MKKKLLSLLYTSLIFLGLSVQLIYGESAKPWNNRKLIIPAQILCKTTLFDGKPTSPSRMDVLATSSDPVMVQIFDHNKKVLRGGRKAQQVAQHQFIQTKGFAVQICKQPNDAEVLKKVVNVFITTN